MFNVAIIIYFVLLVFIIINNIQLLFIKLKNKKKENNKDLNGLTICQEILKYNNTNIYITNIKNQNSHYDISRNVIRLSDEVYEQNNNNSISYAVYLVTKALSYKKVDRSKYGIINLVAIWMNRILFFTFVLGVYLDDISFMIASLVGLIGIMVYSILRTNQINNILDDNIEYLAKKHKLSDEEIDLIYKEVNLLIQNNLTVHIINNKF